MKIIKANEGMILTNGTVYAKEVRLGDWDDRCNYHEITQEEYEKVMEAELIENAEILSKEV